jgi:hypothetical protein
MIVLKCNMQNNLSDRKLKSDKSYKILLIVSFDVIDKKSGFSSSKI